MAPECLRGEAPDRRCDIWALGVTLYEALTGKRPFPSQDRRELERQIQDEEPAPLPASLPLQLRRVVGRCLEKSPARRYQRAGEVRSAMEEGPTDRSFSGAEGSWRSWRSFWLCSRPRPRLPR
jgi:serine/threonine-protein kinase